MPEIQFSDDDPAYQEVLQRAKALGVSPAEYIRLAIEAFVEGKGEADA